MSDNAKLNVNVMSFGFMYGAPENANFVFDARFLRNPFYIDVLTGKNGQSKEIQEYLNSFKETIEYSKKIHELVDFIIPQYIAVGKGSINVCIGCTGGMHRSVALAEGLARHLSERKDINVKLIHREKESGNW